MTAIKKSTENASTINYDDTKKIKDNRHLNTLVGKDMNNGNIGTNALDIEKARFFLAVSNGVSLLIQEHGYSKARATSLILEEIRQNDDHPSDEEVFNAMKSLHLGMDDARKTIIVAQAFKRSLNVTKTSKEDAVRNLTSKLETSKLLNKVVRPTLHSLEGRSSSSDSVPDFKTLLNECKHLGSKEKEIQSHTKSNFRNVSNIQRNVKTKSRATASIGKTQRKRQLPLEETSDVDPVVKKKTINLKEHNKSDRSSSPSPAITRKRSSPEHQVSQPSKRPRCDSV